MAKLVKGEQNGWNEYSKLVIAELERLNDELQILIQKFKALSKRLQN